METLRLLRRINRLLAASAAVVLVSGCTDVVRSTPEDISIDTEPLGNLMPGTRHWLAWPKANEYCGAQGKSPQLHDLEGSVVLYRCISEESGR